MSLLSVSLDMFQKHYYLILKKGYYPEEVEKKSYIESSVQLFKKQSDVDYSIVTDRPVGKGKNQSNRQQA